MMAIYGIKLIAADLEHEVSGVIFLKSVRSAGSPSAAKAPWQSIALLKLKNN